MLEFEIDGKQYRTMRKLSAFEQLHMARKLAPLIAKMAPHASNQEANDFISLLAPVIDGLSEMPAEDVDLITQKCVSIVQRQQGQNWAAVWNERGKSLMFDDIDAMQLLQISFQVIQDNLANFTRALPWTAQSPTPQTTANPENLSSFPTVRAG